MPRMRISLLSVLNLAKMCRYLAHFIADMC